MSFRTEQPSYVWGGAKYDDKYHEVENEEPNRTPAVRNMGVEQFPYPAESALQDYLRFSGSLAVQIRKTSFAFATLPYATR